MKVNVIRAVKLLCLLLPVLLIMQLLPLRTSDNLVRIRDYYREEENSLDVVFLGASEVFAGVSSALAYGEYGYTSYPYCLSSNYVDFFKYQLDDIYRTQSPQWIVVDISGAVRPDVPENADALLREFVEEMPLSVNKLRAIHRLGDREQLLSYYMPFMMYHGSADRQLVEELIREERSALAQDCSSLKGVMTCTAFTLEGELITPTPEALARKEALPGVSEEKLRELLEYCREKGYDNILFAAFPHRIASDYAVYRLQLFNQAEELISSYGYDFLNLEAVSHVIGIDPQQDYYNDEHLNIYGQQKLTRYLSERLIRDYGLTPAPQTQENKTRWDSSYDDIRRYYRYVEKLIREQPGVEHWVWEEQWQLKAIRRTELPGD